VVAAVVGLLVLGLVWLLVLPRVVPTLGRDALLAEVEDISAVVGGDEIEVRQTETFYGVYLAIETDRGAAYSEKIDELDDELARRGWVSLPRPDVTDARIDIYRVKVVGGRLAYAEAVTGMMGGPPEEMPDTATVHLKFVHQLL